MQGTKLSVKYTRVYLVLYIIEIQLFSVTFTLNSFHKVFINLVAVLFLATNYYFYILIL